MARLGTFYNEDNVGVDWAQYVLTDFERVTNIWITNDDPNLFLFVSFGDGLARRLHPQEEWAIYLREGKGVEEIRIRSNGANCPKRITVFGQKR